MLVHLDTSVLVDAFTGARRSLGRVETATRAGHVLAYCALVEYEWLRGPRTSQEAAAARRFFGSDMVVPVGEREAAGAASLYRRVKRARQRHADLVVAACAIEHRARLWTLNTGDFDDIPGLSVYPSAD
jgi:predicted nucleic acid-binding protein